MVFIFNTLSMFEVFSVNIRQTVVEPEILVWVQGRNHKRNHTNSEIIILK